MFLIAHNQVFMPKQYFEDIAPAVSELSAVAGGLFLNKMILNADNQVIDYEQAVSSSENLTRLVVMYFENLETFKSFWDCGKRNEIWLVGENYAYFCDSVLDISEAQPKLLQKADEKVSELVTLRRLGLTERECEILYWISQGKRNQDIADLLNISLGTIKKHCTRIFDKMGVSTRAAAAAMATEALMEKTPTTRLLF